MPEQMTSGKLLLTIKPALTCQFILDCHRVGTHAIIWTNNLLPTRWVMMPVCDRCLSAAITAYEPTTLQPICDKRGAK